MRTLSRWLLPCWALLLIPAAQALTTSRWTDSSLPDLTRGESALQLLAVRSDDSVLQAELQTVRLDPFDGGWESDLELIAGGSIDRGDRQLRLIRIDGDCQRTVERERRPLTRWCDQLLVQVRADALIVNYQSPEADTSFELQLWPSPDEPGVWRSPRLGREHEPLSIAVRLQPRGEALLVNWIEGEQLPHYSQMLIEASTRAALGLSAIEASLLAFADLAAALADLEGPEPVQLPAWAQRHAREWAATLPALAPRDPWPQCAANPQACGLSTEASCAGFQCGLCQHTPAGTDERACLATLYGVEVGPDDPLDTQCFLFICWSQNDGGGGGVGGGGGAGGGNGGIGDFAPHPDCVEYDGSLWQENPFDRPDLELRQDKRKHRPIALYFRSTSSIEVTNTSYNNRGCGTQGIGASNANALTQVFLNEQRVSHDYRAWDSFANFDLAYGLSSPAGVVNYGVGPCAAIGKAFPLTDVFGEGLAMANYTLTFNRILSAECRNHFPAADQPMHYGERVWVHLSVDPYDAVDEDDESNNRGYTRNWVKLRAP